MKNLVFATMLLLLFTACAGTDTGNPFDQERPTGEDCSKARCASPPLVAMYAAGLCEKLVSCGLTDASVLETCLNQLRADDQLPRFFNLLGVARTGAELMSLNSQGKLRWENDQANVCRSQMINLSCDSNVIQAAYSTSSPNDFTRVSKMADGSLCEGLFEYAP